VQGQGGSSAHSPLPLLTHHPPHSSAGLGREDYRSPPPTAGEQLEGGQGEAQAGGAGEGAGPVPVPPHGVAEAASVGFSADPRARAAADCLLGLVQMALLASPDAFVALGEKELPSLGHVLRMHSCAALSSCIPALATPSSSSPAEGGGQGTPGRGPLRLGGLLSTMLVATSQVAQGTPAPQQGGGVKARSTAWEGATVKVEAQQEGAGTVGREAAGCIDSFTSVLA